MKQARFGEVVINDKNHTVRSAASDGSPIHGQGISCAFCLAVLVRSRA